jgi:hypothetical protein
LFGGIISEFCADVVFLHYDLEIGGREEGNADEQQTTAEFVVKVYAFGEFAFHYYEQKCSFCGFGLFAEF